MLFPDLDTKHGQKEEKAEAIIWHILDIFSALDWHIRLIPFALSLETQVNCHSQTQPNV